MAHPLRAYRESVGLTQAELADILGVERTTVARWETGVRRVDPELLRLIEEKTGIPPHVLRPDLAELFTAPSAAWGQ